MIFRRQLAKIFQQENNAHVNIFYVAQISIDGGESIGETSGMFYVEVKDGVNLTDYRDVFIGIQNSVKDDVLQKLKKKHKNLSNLNRDDITVTFTKFQPISF